eukprot:CAMPEP_0179188422 /NCGR_PEP_ID=MMETSP0796-20121207/93516_1 /TAXON_ID=73915 /ORGANISM="Pyrodinium bahamense, Strain pbaha01" /LENGTH=172 /DNA_ID=CAMNT_0020892521 /DNA_START=318 /DNA_END=837 /DNA_ORIENTATION=-
MDIGEEPHLRVTVKAAGFAAHLTCKLDLFVCPHDRLLCVELSVGCFCINAGGVPAKVCQSVADPALPILLQKSTCEAWGQRSPRLRDLPAQDLHDLTEVRVATTQILLVKGNHGMSVQNSNSASESHDPADVKAKALMAEYGLPIHQQEALRCPEHEVCAKPEGKLHSFVRL